MTDSNYRQQLAELVHEKSVEILQEVGFCAPEPSLLKRLDSAGFNVDFESSMVRISPELLDEALKTLPKPMKLYSREGGESSPFDAGTCFMGAGTPVNVFDL